MNGEAIQREIVEKLLAGGWVSAILLVLVVGLTVAVVSRQRIVVGLRRQLRGARVRGGHVAEALAPFLRDFPVDIAKPGASVHFLGQPVDYVVFDPEDGVTFIEVKSGSAKLDSRQRGFRRLVEAGEVRWATFRVPS